jgi:hypothetical protein
MVQMVGKKMIYLLIVMKINNLSLKKDKTTLAFK